VSPEPADFGGLLPQDPVRALAKATATAPNAEEKLAQVITTYQGWLYLPDPTPLLAILGTVAANLMQGDPVWLLLVGAPGGGKTEMLQPLCKLKNVIVTSTLTEASLLSATPSRDKARGASGGLLRTVGSLGILLCKDFTSVLAMNRDKRASVLAALREVYDGSWTRHVGVDGGATLHWEGKLGVIGACTSVIDTHHAVMASMGERFVMYRLPPLNEEELAAKALNHQGSELLMRQELSLAVGRLFSDLALEGQNGDRPDSSRLIPLATMAVRCRSAVERDGHTREVELIPEAEAPSRLALVLARLFSGIRAIGGTPADAWRVIAKVAMDCVPALRLRVIRMLALAAVPVDLTTISDAVHYPTQTTRRTLEDLTLHRVVRRNGHGQGKPDTWTLTDWTKDKCRAAGVTFPEMSGDENGSTFPEMLVSS
jgi:hypothetical protein